MQSLKSVVESLRVEIGELKSLLGGNGNSRHGLIGGAISTAAGMLPSIPGVSSSK